MERFIKVALNIHNLSLKVALHHMITALRSGPFADSLYKKLIDDLDELRCRVAKFMQLMELCEFRSKARAAIVANKRETKKFDKQ